MMIQNTRVVAVNVNWNGDEWNLNAYTLDYNNRWNADNHFFSLDTRIFLSFYERFLFY